MTTAATTKPKETILTSPTTSSPRYSHPKSAGRRNEGLQRALAGRRIG